MSDNQGIIYACKYGVSNLIFMMEDQKVICDHSHVMSIEYLNDYEINIRSVLKVKLRLDIRKKIWLLRNKTNIICKFELSKKGMDVDNDNYITDEKTVWNLEFGIYFTEAEDNIDLDLLEERLKMNEGNNYQEDDIINENLFESENIIDVYLFNNDMIKSSNYLYNEVFTKNTLQQMVGRLLTESKHKKVLMSRFENDEVYKELLVPANPAYKCLIYLDQYYGFYKKGAVIYYDLDRLYILNPNDKCNVKEKDEWPETTFLISKFDNTIPDDAMHQREGEKIFYCQVAEENINTKQFSVLNNANEGSKTKIVSVDSNNIEIEEAEQSYIDSRNEMIVYVRDTDNKFTKDILKRRMEEDEIILYISANNLDINAFTPNKIYQVVFEETTKQEKYGKNKYRLVYAYHILRMESENYLTSAHRIVLKKATS